MCILSDSYRELVPYGVTLKMVYILGVIRLIEIIKHLHVILSSLFRDILHVLS